jgi:hypothetical protein
VDVGDAANVSEVYVASIFKVETWMVYFCVYTSLGFEKDEGTWGRENEAWWCLV